MHNFGVEKIVSKPVIDQNGVVGNPLQQGTAEPHVGKVLNIAMHESPCRYLSCNVSLHSNTQCGGSTIGGRILAPASNRQQHTNTNNNISLQTLAIRCNFKVLW